jgi:hypothetical protein
MKAVHVGLLAAASALTGGLVIKLTEKPAPPVAAVAPAPAVATPPAAAPAPAVAQPAQVSAAAPALPEPAAVRKSRSTSRAPNTKRPGSVEMAVLTSKASPPPEPAKSEAARTAPEAPAAPPAVPPAPAEPVHVSPAPPPPPVLNKVTLNAGTLIPVRLVEGLTTERNSPGDPFTATLDKPLVVDGFVIAERGARVEGRVVSVDRGGRVKGLAALAVELTRLHTSDGQAVAIETDSFERHAQESQKDDAVKVGAGAAIGAAIGAIAGGGKGAAIGAGVGGAGGAGGVLLTRGKAATLPSETRVDFRLRIPVTVTERRG